MIKIRDLKQEEIVVGLRVKGLTGRLGTIISIDEEDDNYAYILWDGDTEATSGFYGTSCDIEVLSPD